MKSTGCLLFAIALLSQTGYSQKLDPTPDREVPVDWGDGSYSGVIYWPENLHPETVHPVFFFYHGTGGKPSTSLIRRYTDRKDWIIVGMPYVGGASAPMSWTNMESEVGRIRDILTVLGRVTKVRDQWWVGGFSKGGWTASFFAQMDAPGLAGAAILGAGIMPDGVMNKQGFRPRPGNSKVSVLIGIGQLDTNYVYSLRAVDQFQGKGWNVVLDDYPGMDHTMPTSPMSQGFRQWLRIQAAGSLTPELASESRVWWDDRIATSKTLTKPEERLIYLEETLKLPFASLIPADERNALSNQVAAVAKHPAMATTQRARASLQLGVEAEKRFDRSPELPDIARRYLTTYRENQDSWFGQRALLDAKRVMENQKTLSGQTGDVEIPGGAAMDTAMKMARDIYLLTRGATP